MFSPQSKHNTYRNCSEDELTQSLSSNHIFILKDLQKQMIVEYDCELLLLDECNEFLLWL